MNAKTSESNLRHRLISLAQCLAALLAPAAQAANPWPPEARAMPVLRVARPTNDFSKILGFYREGLGFDLLYEFKDHEGFDGVMLGKKGAPYHFEFTLKSGHKVPNAPSRDNLVVFYLPDKVAYATAVKRMRDAGFDPVPSFNPYWDRGGTTFEDAEGYRVVFYNGAWSK